MYESVLILTLQLHLVENKHKHFFFMLLQIPFKCLFFLVSENVPLKSFVKWRRKYFIATAVQISITDLPLLQWGKGNSNIKISHILLFQIVNFPCCSWKEVSTCDWSWHDSFVKRILHHDNIKVWFFDYGRKNLAGTRGLEISRSINRAMLSTWE